MKTLFALAALCALPASLARADVIPSFRAEGGADAFVAHYRLDSFKIASGSLRLRSLGEIKGGSVQVNEGTNQVRLVLERNTVCGPTALCAAVMLPPLTITLPIHHMDTDICGVLSIVADRNLQLVDGGLLRVTIIDDSHNSCVRQEEGAGRVRVLVSEESPHTAGPALSVMSGMRAE